MQGENEYSIEVQHVDKYFNIYYDKAGSFKEKILFWNRNRKELLLVLMEAENQHC